MSELRLSASTSMLPSWDLATVVEHLTALGYRGVGLTRSTLESFGTAAGVALLQSSELVVTSYQQVDLFDVAEPDRIDRSRLLHDLDVAAELGAQCVYALAGRRGPLPWETAIDALVGQIDAVLPAFADRGLVLALEPIHPLRQDLTFVSMFEDAIDVVDRVGSDRCGVVFDTWHVWWQRRALELLATCGKRLMSVQLSDHKAITLRTLDRAQLGDGIIPWPETLDAIMATGFDGCLDIEVISDDNESIGYDNVLRTAADRLSAWLEPWSDDGLR
jgi:sugar phosphate isomerase/epimerase